MHNYLKTFLLVFSKYMSSSAKLLLKSSVRKNYLITQIKFGNNVDCWKVEENLPARVTQGRREQVFIL